MSNKVYRLRGTDHVDRSIPARGGGRLRSHRVDVGVEIAYHQWRKMKIGPVSRGWIAAFAGCSVSAVETIERLALRKLRRRIPKDLYNEMAEAIRFLPYGNEPQHPD